MKINDVCIYYTIYLKIYTIVFSTNLMKGVQNQHERKITEGVFPVFTSKIRCVMHETQHYQPHQQSIQLFIYFYCRNVQLITRSKKKVLTLKII